MEYGRVIQTKRLKIYEVAEDVFACITPNKGYGWVDAGFITRGKGLFYDTFFDLPHAREMLAAYQELSGREYPGFVVNSHYNADHIFGNQLFPDSTVIMHKNVLIEKKVEPISMFTDIQYADKNPNAPAYLKYFHNEFKGIDFRGIEWHEPDILVDSSFEVLLDGMKAQVLCVAPSHSDSDLLLWLPDERVIFCADVVFSSGGIVAYSEKGMRLWAKAMDTIIDLNPRVIVPGHGGLCDVEHIKELRQYFYDVLDGFEKYYDPDLDSLEIAKKIDITKYVNWLQPERLVTIINALWRGKKGLPQSADMENTIPKLEKLREFYKEKYKGIMKPWDPMSSWKD